MVSKSTAATPAPWFSKETLQSVESEHVSFYEEAFPALGEQQPIKKVVLCEPVVVPKLPQEIVKPIITSEKPKKLPQTIQLAPVSFVSKSTRIKSKVCIFAAVSAATCMYSRRGEPCIFRHPEVPEDEVTPEELAVAKAEGIIKQKAYLESRKGTLGPSAKVSNKVGNNISSKAGGSKAGSNNVIRTKPINIIGAAAVKKQYQSANLFDVLMPVEEEKDIQQKVLVASKQPESISKIQEVTHVDAVLANSKAVTSSEVVIEKYFCGERGVTLSKVIENIATNPLAADTSAMETLLGDNKNNSTVLIEMLFEIQKYCHRNGFPRVSIVDMSLISLLFQLLYANDVIEKDVFLTWSEDTSSAIDRSQGKERAIIQTTAFLNELKEEDEEQDDVEY
jgi:hypothetical protein